MRNVVPFFVMFLASATAALLLLPSDPWSQYQTIRVAVILLIAVPCYLTGATHGRELAEKTANGSAKRRRFQLAFRSLLCIMLLMAAWLGFYCERVRRQTEALETLADIEGVFTHYANGYQWGDSWTERLLGSDFLHTATTVDCSHVPDFDRLLPPLRRLAGLRSVNFYFREAAEKEEAEKAAERFRRELPGVVANTKIGWPP